MSYEALIRMRMKFFIWSLVNILLPVYPILLISIRSFTGNDLPIDMARILGGPELFALSIALVIGTLIELPDSALYPTYGYSIGLGLWAIIISIFFFDVISGTYYTPNDFRYDVSALIAVIVSLLTSFSCGILQILMLFEELNAYNKSSVTSSKL